MSPIANARGRRLVERISLVGLAVFIGFSIAAFGQAAFAIAVMTA